MNVGKRLFQYALKRKRTFIFALVMLMLAVAAELSGPFIAKRMIDVHIVGIEKPWYEGATGDQAVAYQGKWYKREDRFEENETKGKEVRILQVGVSYYFVNEAIAFDGAREIDGDTLTITRNNETKEYSAVQLSKDELLPFYDSEVNGLLTLATLYIGLMIMASIFTYGKAFYLQKASNSIIRDMREDVFSHIQRLPVSYFDKLPAGKIVSRVTNDTESIRDLYVTVLATFFSGVIYVTGILIALFLLDATLATYCLLIIPILYLWIVLYRKYASRYNHIIRGRLSDINGMINESINGMSIIQAFRQQKETAKEFGELSDDYYRHQNKLLSLNAATSHNLVGVLRSIAFMAMIWYFGGTTLSGQMVVTVGVLYAFVDYLIRMFSPITGMVNQLAILEQALVSAERVFELLDEKGTDVNDTHIDRYKGDVSFQNVSFSYNNKDVVLKNINIDVKQGETVALVGHTGSGKSSIMNVLFGFYPFQEGNITIDNYPIKEMPKQLYREHMGIVLQDPFLFSGTIASNISLDNPAISRERIEKVIKEIGADVFISKLPKGLDEPVLEKGSTLSTGERQLISFARALAFDPAILILDEATSSIDTETESIIQEALEVLKKGRTTFIIAHRLSTIRSADQILVLDRGNIVERGTHDELMARCGRYYKMYQLQQAGSVTHAS
ncbi:ABC transporter ATP-binding protein [Priestia taiwanensis]|uniref:Multidrug ABC transporter permease n=1 Tax=Priestia taiwanensis TaxID=1347902 RepID=A0A917AV50_9BACI|nr:ABC transporter ATP-binding protein [Priestia taiwanensis]MBM7364269.1 ATP-binding cassette subfamily B protein [Priestia taiwanensis]GGE73075.1 multidrug ABC transporter permease [Priestia taiwanensis]